MVRRRTASPKASSPVRGSSSGYRAPPPPQQRAPVPTAGPMPGAAPSQGPGLMGQMAATAGGVAIGSAVGHSIGHMMTGGGNSGQPQEVQGQPQYAQQQQYQQPCELEWKQFLECSQNSSDLGFCQNYNDLFKQCKSRNNM